MKGKQAVITGGLILILAVGGVFISIYVLRGPGPVPKSQGEPQSQTEQEQTAVEETPASEVSPYYLGTVTIMESQTSYNAVGGTMQTASDVTYVSEELLVFDEKTQKLYIMGRFLTFEGTMEAAGNLRGMLASSVSGSYYGESAEKYGRGGVLDKTGYMIDGKKDYLNIDFPIRANVESNTIYTNPPTEETDWVTTQIGNEIYFGPPLVVPPVSFADIRIFTIPEAEDIDISYTYEDTPLPNGGMMLTIDGVINLSFRRVNIDEAAQFGKELTQEISIIRLEREEERQRELEENADDEYGDAGGRQEFIPPLPELPGNAGEYFPYIPPVPTGN